MSDEITVDLCFGCGNSSWACGGCKRLGPLLCHSKSARAVYVHDLIHRIKLLGNLAWYATDAKGQVSAFLQKDAAVAYAGANKGKVFDLAGLRAGVTGR